jgi:hypothetical protein
MNRILATTAIAFAFCAPTLAHAASDFVSVMNDTGCDSRYSDEKKANIATQYLGQPTTVTGIVTFIDNGKVGIRVLRTTLSHDVQIYLANPKAGYNLEKDRMITVQFVLKSIGGCFWPYTGDQGITEAEARAAAADADTAANDARVAIERDARAKAEATRARIEADAKA